MSSLNTKHIKGLETKMADIGTLCRRGEFSVLLCSGGDIDGEGDKHVVVI